MPNVTVSDLEKVLERMKTIGDLLLESSSSSSSSSSSFCSSTNNYNVTVTFLRNIGNQPLLELYSDDSLQGGSVIIYTVQDGLEEDIEECGGYGLCDEQEGVCSCLSGGRSSDGMGEYQGTVGDCSFDVYT